MKKPSIHQGRSPAFVGQWMGLVCLLSGLVASALAQGQASLDADSPVIRTLDDLGALPQTLVSRTNPVQLEATVLYYDPIWKNLWVRDRNQTNSYLNPSSTRLPIRSGQKIEIEGTTKAGERAIDFHTARCRVLAESNQPPAKDLHNEPLETKVHDNLRVQLQGRARLVNTVDQHLLFDLIVGNSVIKVFVLLEEKDVVSSLDEALVRLRGVYGATFDRAGKLSTLQLNVAGLADLEVLEPDLSRSFSVPLHTLSSLDKDPSNVLVRVQGTVKQQSPTRWLVLEDATGQVRIETWQARPVKAGQAVEAVGYPETRGPDLYLRAGLFRPLETVPTSTTGEGDKGVPTLRRIDRVRELSSEEAKRGYRVSLRGVVTCFRPATGLWFLQDSTAGIEVRPMGKEPALQAGDWVELTGRTAAGGLAPTVVDPVIARRSTALLPEAHEVSLAHLWTGAEDGRWVEVRGYVRGVHEESQGLRLEVSMVGGEVSLCTPPSTTLARLRGAVVRARGVCRVQLNARRQFTGLELCVPSKEYVEVEEAAPVDPFAVPASAVLELRQLNALNTLYRRVGVVGTVTLHVPGQYLCLQEGDEALLVLSGETTPLQPGDRAEVVGFPSREQHRLILRDAVCRKIGTTREPTPRTLDPVALLDEDLEPRLVEVEGVLLHRARKPDELRLTVQTQAAVFDAVAPGPSALPELEAIPMGSRLKLRGVYRLRSDESRQPRALRLHLRTAEDVQVLARPSWWTPQRLVHVVAGLSVLALAGIGWGMTLSRRVAAQTRLIRQRLEHEAALEARYRDLVETANDVIVTCDLNGRFTSFNQAAERVLGYDRSEARRLSFPDIVVPAHRPRLEEVWRECQEGRGIQVFEVDVLTKDGHQLTLETSPRLMLEGGHPVGMQGICRDITERRNLETQLRQAQKMESVGQLAAGIAHDFNNIMTVIQGHTGLLLEEPSFSVQTREALSQVAVSANRAAELTRQLLTFSRRQRMQPTVLNLNGILEGVTRMLQRLVGEQITLRLEEAANLPSVRADVSMMEQVIMNLAVNARDAMPFGGTLTLSTQAMVLDEELALRNPEARPGTFVTLTVVDTGCGMDAATLERVFEPFFTTKEIGQATGLGLATVYGIVKQHGGWIEVASQPQRGTVFRIYLPAWSGEAPTPASPPAKAAALPGGHETILIVEDEPAVRSLVEQVLRRHGYRTLCAANGPDALTLWQE